MSAQVKPHIANLIRHIRAAAAADLHCYWMNEVDFLFDDDLQGLVLDIVGTAPGALAGGLLEVLVSRA